MTKKNRNKARHPSNRNPAKSVEQLEQVFVAAARREHLAAEARRDARKEKRRSLAERHRIVPTIAIGGEALGPTVRKDTSGPHELPPDLRPKGPFQPKGFPETGMVANLMRILHASGDNQEAMDFA